MTTLTLETILDSNLNNQPATKADLRNMGMHFESKFERVDIRLEALDTKITNLGTDIRQDLAAFKLEIRQLNTENLRHNIYFMIGFALTAIGMLAAAPIFS
jgi:hypothetical protein